MPFFAPRFRGPDNLPYEKTGGKNRSIADEIPFDIPDSWEWVRCGEIFQHNTGKALNSSNRSGSLLKYITTSNLYWDRFELANLKEMFFTDAEIEKCTVCKGDLLVCEGGDFGRAAIWNFDTSILIQNHIHRLRSYAVINTRFFYYLFFFYKAIGFIGGKGIGIQGLSSNALHSLLFPLPPLAEQKRIVAKIEELLPHLDEYDQVETRVEKLNAEFPEQLKKSILQWAIQGKLVPQDPSDEPASVFLERIRAEKAKLVKAGRIKKSKNESVIFRRDNSHYEKLNGAERCIDDEIPFEIPDSWAWVRLNDLYNFIDYRGKTPTKTSAGIPLITAKNVKAGYISYIPAEYISEREFSERKSRGISRKGDILFTTEAPLGNAAIADLDIYSAGQRIITFQQYGCDNTIDNQLILYFILSPYFQAALKNKHTGTTVAGIKAEKLKQIVTPLPPLAEQKRIVSQIEKLFSVLGTMRF